MIRSLTAVISALAVTLGTLPAVSQEAEPPQPDALQAITTTEISPEKMALAMQIVKLSGTGRTFNELLPTIADQAKNAFIRANPQMQLGIIEVVDRIALTLVGRRPELDQQLARVWASGFTDEEMQDLVDFYSSETGRKYADLLPRLLAVEMAAAQNWGRGISQELTEKVTAELRATMAAEQDALQSDIAGPAGTGGEAPAPAPAQ